MMEPSQYSFGYMAGQLAFINTMLSNCDEDLAYLKEDMHLLKSIDARNVWLEYKGRLDAIKELQKALREAWLKVKKREKSLKITARV